MSDTVLHVAMLFGIFFSCLAIILASRYLSIAVVKRPLIVMITVGLLVSGLVVLFLKFVGKMSPERQGDRYEMIAMAFSRK